MTIRRLLPLAFFACLLFASDDKPAKTTKAEPKYEMTNYIMGLLRRGPNWTPTATEETQRIQDGHMANIRKMAATGKLIVAGPFTDNGDLRGVFIFHGASMEEAKAMVDQDPAVKAGRLVVDLHPWFAASGLHVNAPK
jgi:uncharacterized protein